ncbi:MAG: hypothetical protein JXA43_00320 [Candidatus Diapherotrites archaeon]|nr:hypothetical protein [Candidatus Diapherotrites archaeon]
MLKSGGFQMDIFAKLEDFYFDLEDKYYAFIDAMAAKGIPLYKVSDFLDDKGIPPFPVFMGLIGLLILGIVSLTLAGPASGKLTVSAGYLGEPVSGLTIKVSGENLTDTALTDDYGVVQFTGLPLNQDYTITISSDLYTADAQIVTLSDYEQSEFIDLFSQEGGVSVFVLLKNSETEETIPEDSKISFQVCTTGLCDTFEPEKKTKGWEISGLLPGSTIDLTVQSTLYSSQSKSIYVEKDGIVKEVYLDPTGLQLLGDGQVEVDLVDSTGSPVEGVTVALLNKVTNQELGSAKSNFEGRALVTINDGVPAYVYVLVTDETSVYASYNSSSDAKEGEPKYIYLEDDFDSPFLWGTITLKSGGVSSDVRVTDESGTGVYDATVRVMQGETELGNKKTDFSGLATVNGLDPEKVYLFAAWAEGYIPAVLESNPMSKIDLQIESATSGNSGSLTVEVQDPYGVTVNDATVELYSSNGKLLGYPTGTTDLSGEVKFENVVSGNVIVKANAGGLTGSSTVNVNPGSAQKLTIKLGETSGDTVRVTVLVTDAVSLAPIIGATIKFTDPIDGSTIVETSQTTESGVLLDVDVGTQADMWISAEGYKTYSERVEFTQDLTKEIRLELGSETPDTDPKAGTLYVEFLGFYTSDCNDQLYTVTKNSTVCVKAKVNWPDLLTPYNGGFHIRAGPDGTEVDDQGYYFTNMMSGSGFGNFNSGTNYTPPSSELSDVTEGIESKSKFIEVNFTNPTGSIVVNSVLKLGDVELDSDVEIKYRAWVEKGSTWLRYPEDATLGTKAESEIKDALYSNTYSAKGKVAEIAAKCTKGNLCVSSGIGTGAFVVDQEKAQALSTDLYQGKIYGMLFYFISKEALNPAVTVKAANDNTNLLGYDLEEFGASSASGSGKQLDTTLSLDEQGLQKMWVYVKANETADQTQYTESITITLKEGEETLQVKKYALVFKPIRDLKLEMEQSWQAGGVGDLEVNVKDSAGLNVTGAKVTLENEEGAPLGNGTVTGTTNVSGVATFDNFGSIVGSGIIKVTAEKENYKNDVSRIVITSDGLQVTGNGISLPKDVRSGVVPISVFNTYGGVPAKNVSLEIIPIDGEYADDFGFSLEEESLGTLDGRETQTINVIVNYTGPLTQIDPKPTARFKVLVKGEVEGLQIAETSEIIVMYGGTYDLSRSCVQLSLTPANGVNLAGVTGETTTVDATVLNKCDFDITVLTAKVTPEGEAYDSQLVDVSLDGFDALESQIETVLKPGMEKEFSISITPKEDIGESADKKQGTLKLDLLAYLGASKEVTNLIDTQSIPFTLYYPVYSLFVCEEAQTGGCKLKDNSEVLFSGYTSTIGVDEEGSFEVLIKNNTGVPVTDVEVIEPNTPDVLIDSSELEKLDNILAPGKSVKIKVTMTSQNPGTFTDSIKVIGDYGGKTITREIPLTLIFEETSCLKITTPSLLLSLSLGTPKNTPILTVRNECSENVLLSGIKGPGGIDSLFGVVSMSISEAPIIPKNGTSSIAVEFSAEGAESNVPLGGAEIYFTGSLLESNLDVKSGSLAVDGAYINDNQPVDTRSTRYAALEGCLNLQDEDGIPKDIARVFIPKIDYEGEDCDEAYCDVKAFSLSLQSDVETLDNVAGKITSCSNALEETSEYCLFSATIGGANSKTYYLMNDNISGSIIQNVFDALGDTHTVSYWADTAESDFSTAIATNIGLSSGVVAIVTNGAENVGGTENVCGKYVITPLIKFKKSSGVLVPGWYTIVLQMRYLPTSECNFDRPENFGLMLPSNTGVPGITALSGSVYFDKSQIPASVDSDAVISGYSTFLGDLELREATSLSGVNTIALKLADLESGFDAEDFRKTYGFGYLKSNSEEKQIEFWTTSSNLANEGELGLGSAMRNYLGGSINAATWCKVDDYLALADAKKVYGNEITVADVDKVLFKPTDVEWKDTRNIEISASPVQTIDISYVWPSAEGAQLSNSIIEIKKPSSISYNGITTDKVELSFEVKDKQKFYEALKAGNNKVEINLQGGYAGDAKIIVEFDFEGGFTPTELVQNIFGFAGQRSHAWDHAGEEYVVYLKSDEVKTFCDVYDGSVGEPLNPEKQYYVPAVCGAIGSGPETIDPTTQGLEAGMAVGIASASACAAAEVGMAVAEIIATGGVASVNVAREAVTCAIVGGAQGVTAGLWGKSVWGSAKDLYDLSPATGNVVLGATAVSGAAGATAAGIQIGKFASKAYIAQTGIEAIKNAKDVAYHITTIEDTMTVFKAGGEAHIAVSEIDNWQKVGLITDSQADSLKFRAPPGESLAPLTYTDETAEILNNANVRAYNKLDEAAKAASKLSGNVDEGTNLYNLGRMVDETGNVSLELGKISNMDGLAAQTDELVDAGKITQVKKGSTVKAKFFGEADKADNPKWRSMAKSAISATIGLVAGGIMYEVVMDKTTQLSKLMPDIDAMGIGAENSADEVHLNSGLYTVAYKKSGKNVEVDIQPYTGSVTAISVANWFTPVSQLK